MPGLFKPGDTLVHDFLDAVAVQNRLRANASPWGPLPGLPDSAKVMRTTGVVVVAEESPGSYRCVTPFGLTILIDESRLKHLNPHGQDSHAAADITSILQSVPVDQNGVPTVGAIQGPIVTPVTSST